MALKLEERVKGEEWVERSEAVKKEVEEDNWEERGIRWRVN